MSFTKKLKLKYLQSSYKPGKVKNNSVLTKVLDDLENMLTPDSGKKKDDKKDDEGGSQES